MKAIFLLLILAMWTSLPAGAEAGAPTDEDMAIVTEYFAQLVRTVQKPFYLYHWRQEPGLVKSPDANLHPEKYGLEIVNREIPNFVTGLYVNGRTSSSMYGGGLYAAVDPVVTEGYGGQNPGSWAILVMRIPAGAKFLDLRARSMVAEMNGQKLRSAFSKLQCPAGAGYGNFIDEILRSNSIAKPCADLLSGLMAKFGVDAYLYGYVTTMFNGCQSETMRSLAAVMTSLNWTQLPGADVELLTANTTAVKALRRTIESQFFYANTVGGLSDVSNANWNLVSSIIQKKHPLYNQMSMSSSQNAEGKSVYSITLTLQDGERVDERFTMDDLKPYFFQKYPDTFHLEPDRSLTQLHWKDLENTPTDKGINNWIQTNTFECADAEYLSKGE